MLQICLICLALCFHPSHTISLASFPVDSNDHLRANQQRVENRILALAKYGKNKTGGTSRVAFSAADVEGRNFMIKKMQEAGLEVRIDFAGNIIGRRPGKFNQRNPILFGSHIDTVPDGGNYDGCVGSIGALEIMEILKENKVETDHPFEMIIFSDEEGGLVGSRALIGTLKLDALDLMSHSGKTIEAGIRYIGGDPARLPEVELSSDDYKAFLELHIEQGGILDTEGIQIGVVEGIVGIEWWGITIEGFANHAGTTPMHMRQDALLAGAKLTVAINEVVNSYEGSQVGTVGRMDVQPSAPNVIPGKVLMSLEIRDLSQEKIFKLFADIEEKAKVIAKETDTKISFELLDVSAVPAITDERIKKFIVQSAEKLKLSYKRMPSGAGHDAQDLAKITPTGMIFVPSVGGISHSPKEYTRPEDMANGVNVLLHTLLALDKKDL